MIAIDDARGAVLTLLAARAPFATICPSEVARSLASASGADTGALDWRDMMPLVHAAVDQLVDQGGIRLSWKGRTLAVRSGPYRIGRGVREAEG
jgi:hypothetical protein